MNRFVDLLEIDESVTLAFEADGITEPTAIQAEAIPPILEGRHVVIESGTGTGKTLAYLLPLLQRLRDGTDRAAVIAPTSELAMQTFRVATRYGHPELKVGAMVSTTRRRAPTTKVTRSTRLIVGTPGRILEAYRGRKMKRVTTVVLDEPDPILAGQDDDYLTQVLTRPDPKIQLIVVGATLGGRTERLLRDVVGEEVHHARVADSPLQGAIEHRFVVLRDGAARDARLAAVIAENRCRRSIVFANRPATVRHLFRFLGDRDLRPATVTADRSKQERRAALDRMKRSDGVRVLITNDVAGRGLDLPDVDWVFHYDLPSSAQAYVHRAGRTGRGGRSGTSVMFVTDAKRYVLDRYSRELGITFEPLRRRRR